MKPITLENVINESLANEDFKFSFEKELLINSISEMIYKMRKIAGLTQKELARKSGTTQPVIARLESGKDTRIPSLELLSRLASASQVKLSINFTQNL